MCEWWGLLTQGSDWWGGVLAVHMTQGRRCLSGAVGPDRPEAPTTGQQVKHTVGEVRGVTCVFWDGRISRWPPGVTGGKSTICWLITLRWPSSSLMARWIPDNQTVGEQWGSRSSIFCPRFSSSGHGEVQVLLGDGAVSPGEISGDVSAQKPEGGGGFNPFYICNERGQDLSVPPGVHYQSSWGDCDLVLYLCYSSWWSWGAGKAWK